MSILHNGQDYGAVQVINYSAALDYNRGVEITNIQDGTYIAPDNGYILITLKSEQSNPTKVSVLRNKEPITDVGEEIASRILQQYQYSETLTVNVLARDYYKLFIEGAGNPKILKCMFYPFASTVPMKLIDTITPEQIDGVLPISKGGTGAKNINDARKNLETFNQARLPNKADLNNLDLYEKDRIVMNLTGFDHVNRPEPNGAQTGAFVTYIDTVHNRGWQRFYQVGHGDNGSFTEWARTYNNGVWGEWIRFRNRNGSVSLPIGFIYFQLRDQSTPDQLFGAPSKWQDISSTYAGEFFRALGGNSGSFGSKQSEGLPNIVGVSEGLETSKPYGVTGCFGVTAAGGGKINTANSGGINYRLTFNAGSSNSIYGATAHVTPYNSAIRIWKKIS